MVNYTRRDNYAQDNLLSLLCVDVIIGEIDNSQAGFSPGLLVLSGRGRSYMDYGATVYG